MAVGFIGAIESYSRGKAMKKVKGGFVKEDEIPSSIALINAMIVEISVTLLEISEKRLNRRESSVSLLFY